MAKWNDLPPEIKIAILRDLCTSTAVNLQRWPSTFDEKRPFAKVMKHTYPRPLVDYTSALLTCREWYNTITNAIKFPNNQSTLDVLQLVQGNLLITCSDRMFNGDYREMELAQSMYGCFWKNPYVCETFSIFDDLFGGLGRTGQTILVGLLGRMLDKCKQTQEPGEHIKAQRALKNGSYRGLVFTTGQYYVEGERMCCDTVSSCELATFIDHEINSAPCYEEVDDEEFELVPNKWEGFPDVSTAAPDTWWFVVDFNNDYWKNWYLVNYKEGKLITGPTGTHLDHLMERVYFWQREGFEGDFLEASNWIY